MGSPASGLRNSLVVSCGPMPLIKMQPILAILCCNGGTNWVARLPRLGHHWYRSPKLILNGLYLTLRVPGLVFIAGKECSRFALMLIWRAVGPAIYEYW